MDEMYAVLKKLLQQLVLKSNNINYLRLCKVFVSFYNCVLNSIKNPFRRELKVSFKKLMNHYKTTLHKRLNDPNR